MASNFTNPFGRHRPLINFQRYRSGDTALHRGGDDSNRALDPAQNPLQETSVDAIHAPKMPSDSGQPLLPSAVLSAGPVDATDQLPPREEPHQPKPATIRTQIPRQGIPRKRLTPQTRYRRISAEMKAPRPPVKRVPLDMEEHAVPPLPAAYFDPASRSPFQPPFPASKRVPLDFEVHVVSVPRSNSAPGTRTSSPNPDPLHVNDVNSMGESDVVPHISQDGALPANPELDFDSERVSLVDRTHPKTGASSLGGSVVNPVLFVPETPKGSSQASIHFEDTGTSSETAVSRLDIRHSAVSPRNEVDAAVDNANYSASAGKDAPVIDLPTPIQPSSTEVPFPTARGPFVEEEGGVNPNDSGIEEDLTFNEEVISRLRDNHSGVGQGKTPSRTSEQISVGLELSKPEATTTGTQIKAQSSKRSRAPSRGRSRKEPKTPKYVLDDENESSGEGTDDETADRRGRKKQRVARTNDEDDDDDDEYAQDRRRFNPSRAAKMGITHNTLAGALKGSFGDSKGKSVAAEDHNDGPDLRTWMLDMFGQLWWPGFDPHHRAWKRYNDSQGLGTGGRALVPDIRYTFEQSVLDAAGGEDLGRWGYIKDPGKGFQELPYDTLYEGLDDAISQLEGELTWTLSRVQVNVRTQLKNLLRYRAVADSASGAIKQYTLKMHKILEGASSMAQFKAVLRCMSIKEELRLMRRQRCLTARLTINEMLSDPDQDPDDPNNLNWADLLFLHARYVDEAAPHEHDYDVGVVQEHPPTMMNYSSDRSGARRGSVRDDLNSIRDVDMFMETSISTPRSHRAQSRRVFEEDDVDMRPVSDVLGSDAMDVIQEEDDVTGVVGDRLEVLPGSDMAGVEDGY